MTYAWQRKTWQSFNQSDYVLLASLVEGQTLIRTRFGWSAGGATASYTDLFSVHGEQVIMALETTIGDGSETPTLPVDDPADQDPPSQRYLWWEGRAMYVDAFPQSSSGTGSFTSKEASEFSDAKGQVKAPAMAAGDFLNLWMVYETDITWPPGVTPYVTAWASTLIQSS